MSKRKKYSANTLSEKRVGYSRAVRSKDGKRLYISGTTSVDGEGVIQGKTVYEQTDYVFNKIKTVVKDAGFIKKDIVLVRAFLVDMASIAEFDKAFINHFKEVSPACTLVGVSELVEPDLLIEIECIVDKD